MLIFTFHLPCLTKQIHRYYTKCINALLCEISTSNSVGKGYKKAHIADLFHRGIAHNIIHKCSYIQHSIYIQGTKHGLHWIHFLVKMNQFLNTWGFSNVYFLPVGFELNPDDLLIMLFDCIHRLQFKKCCLLPVCWLLNQLLQSVFSLR